MELNTANNETVKVYYDPITMPLTVNPGRITRLFIQRGNREEPYRVTVKPVDGNYELKGKVDSEQTRRLVLSMVHVNHPWRDIIDHLTVSPDIAA